MRYFSLKHLLLMVIASSFVCSNAPLFANTQKKPVYVRKLKKLEDTFGGRIGIYAVDMNNNEHIEYRSQERFPIQSTFKLMGVSAILKKSMTDSNLLQKRMWYKKQNVVFWSPITEKHLNDGMAIVQLCAAVMIYSDNTAINLLMKKLGGPKAVTAFARSMGDNTFTVENWEPKLNSNPHNSMDTSTPEAMGKSLQKLAIGNVLALPQRKQLIIWMKANTTGDKRIRAGVPKGWPVADKTGSSNSFGIANDIGIIWPPKCSAPIIVAIYTVHNQKDAKPRDEVIASATRILIHSFSQTDRCIQLKSSHSKETVFFKRTM